MSTQSKTMPLIDLKVYIRVVAAVFSISSATAFVMALLRLLNPELFYLETLDHTDKGHKVLHTFLLFSVCSYLLIREEEKNKNSIHYFISGMMLITGGIGFLNSLIVMNRSSTLNTGRNITVWLLLDSLFETSRVIYVFVCEIILKGKGTWQVYELLISVAQYLLDSFLYCQMILRH